MYDPELSAIVREAFARLGSDAQDAGQTLGELVASWIRDVYPGENPQDAFLNPDAFPLFLLPWYAEASLIPKPDRDFQSDLVYSTINGYYAVRFIDNLMDGHSEETLGNLPLLNFFYTNFQTPYQKYFTHEHPFWGYFRSVWFHSAEVSILDAQYSDIDLERFMEVSAQKTCAVRIPVAAVFYRHGCPVKIELWEHFTRLFGCWHQMLDDLRDFPRDEVDGSQTFFLSEASRRKRTGETVIDWVIREGHDWGLGLLDGWMADMEMLASQLESPGLDEYLQARKNALSEQSSEAKRTLEQMEGLLSSFKARSERHDH